MHANSLKIESALASERERRERDRQTDRARERESERETVREHAFMRIRTGSACMTFSVSLSLTKYV